MTRKALQRERLAKMRAITMSQIARLSGAAGSLPSAAVHSH
jgi:hypothetical protein